MDSHTLEGLTLRLEAAERGLRGARRAMWTGSILVVLAMGGAAWWVVHHVPTGASQETIEAQHFVVRDAQGAARAVLQQSAGGSTQLVFFRDPLAGDEWRKHTSSGPFSFGVRSLNASSQMVLGDSNSGMLQLSPAILSFDGLSGGPRIALEATGIAPTIWLADSTGRPHGLTATMVTDLATSSTKASPPAKHRRRR